jgi:glutamate-1-semialdehyde aminotransferase
VVAVAASLEVRLCGFPVLDGEAAIVPEVVENEIDLCRLCKALLEEGIRTCCASSCTAAHTERQVERLVDTLDRVAKRLEIEF